MLPLVVLLGILLSIMATQSVLTPLVVVILLLSTAFLFKNWKNAFFVLFLTRPVIDTAYNYNILFGFSPLHFIGVAFPLLTLSYFLQAKHSAPLKARRPMILFLLSNVLSALATMVSNPSEPSFIYGLMIFFQSANFVSAYLLLPFLVESEKELNRFVVMLMIAGLFPLLTGLAQSFGVLPGLKTIRTTGELVRISGWYYDSSNMRFYMFQTIVSSLLVISFNRSRMSRTAHALLLGVMAGSFYVLYRTYSKSALAIMVVGMFMYFLLRRQFVLALSGLVACVIAYAAVDTIRRDVDSLLWKEIWYAQLEDKEQFYTPSLLSGRVGVWEQQLEAFKASDIISKAVGISYFFGRHAHNDFMRVLISTGFIGLSLFVFAYGALVSYLIAGYMRYRDALSIMALIVFAALLIDSFGLTMTLVTSYCWFSFGIMSLSINRTWQKVEKPDSADRGTHAA